MVAKQSWKDSLETVLKEKLTKVIRQWREENLELSLPNSEQQIIDCFRSIERLLAKDILEFYSICGGMIDGDMGESLLSVWTIERIAEENSTSSELTYFADFLINSHLYAFKHENENTSSVYSDWETSEFIKIADSVEQFFELYLTNPYKIGLFEN